VLFTYINKSLYLLVLHLCMKTKMTQ